MSAEADIKAIRCMLEDLLRSGGLDEARRERAVIALAAGSLASNQLNPEMGDVEFSRRTVKLADALLAELDRTQKY